MYLINRGGRQLHAPNNKRALFSQQTSKMKKESKGETNSLSLSLRQRFTQLFHRIGVGEPTPCLWRGATKLSTKAKSVGGKCLSDQYIYLHHRDRQRGKDRKPDKSLWQQLYWTCTITSLSYTYKRFIHRTDTTLCPHNLFIATHCGLCG